MSPQPPTLFQRDDVGETPFTVLYVGHEATAENVRDIGDDGLEIETVPSPADAPTALEDVDGVLAALESSNDAVDLLATVREREPTLPIVLFSESADHRVARAVRSTPWADHRYDDGSDAALSLLVSRLRSLVTQRRTRLLADRVLAALESASDGIAIVAADGTVQTANRAYARTFGYDPTALIGRPWQDLYTDATVARLESTALPTVEDDWRWMGTCDGVSENGEIVSVRTSIAGLEDGGLVFVVSDAASRDESA